MQANPGQPLPILDDASQQRFYLLDESAFLHLQGLANDTERACHDQLQRLILEGIDSPGVPAEEAFARLRNR